MRGNEGVPLAWARYSGESQNPDSDDQDLNQDTGLQCSAYPPWTINKKLAHQDHFQLLTLRHIRGRKASPEQAGQSAENVHNRTYLMSFFVFNKNIWHVCIFWWAIGHVPHCCLCWHRSRAHIIQFGECYTDIGALMLNLLPALQFKAHFNTYQTYHLYFQLQENKPVCTKQYK